MSLLLILGPMKSGKSLDLVSEFAPLAYSDISHTLYQPALDKRSDGVFSRSGGLLPSEKITSLSEIDSNKKTPQVIGIDEVHMFDPDEIWSIANLLQRDMRIILSGLDLDYRGKMFPIVQRFLELGPDEVRYKKAVCEECRALGATHTRVLKEGVPIHDGPPSILPEDGTYEYESVCRNCFHTQIL